MADEYCSRYNVMTTCRFFAYSQQLDCAGFQYSAYKRKCAHWSNLGDEVYHCDSLDAQNWARENLTRREGESE